MSASGPRRVDVLIVGAGAAGLWCAARAAERGLEVLLLEKTPRCGTKVLASGGTRCNLTTTLGPDDAARLFGTRKERFARRCFRALTPRDVRTRFEQLGVPTREAPLEKVFPASGRARDVRDALETWARGAGARVELSSPVIGLSRGEGRWRVHSADGECREAVNLVLAVGGKSVPACGTTGDAYAWLEELGLPLVTPSPALVPLTSPAPWVHALTGISVQEVGLRLEDQRGHVRGRRARPVVFTHRGISGPGAMDLSEPVARYPNEEFRLLLDLAPNVEREQLRGRLIEAAGSPRAPKLSRVVNALAPAPLAKRLLAAVSAQAGLPAAGLGSDPAANALPKHFRHQWIEALKGLALPVRGCLGYSKAEVTAGGLDLKAVDPGSMEVRGCRGLYVIGELLDLQGPIGGLNFQAAFATAEACGLALPPGS